ncbi:LysR family transcriptional regulator [Acidibrevibacterium fodinaquatile]|uniref:LysR family transcriptional regulator n=1 Tax=Acidibrevibacterium fodinaquatile TaxID=1969806 RepID=UPI000E0CCE59
MTSSCPPNRRRRNSNFHIIQDTTQAAAELGVWESTISRWVRDLEDEIGVALFIRHPGGVKLTNAGSRFLNHARMAVNGGSKPGRRGGVKTTHWFLT